MPSFRRGVVLGVIGSSLRASRSRSASSISSRSVIPRFAAQILAFFSSWGGNSTDRTASAHFIGGIPIGETAAHGAVEPYQRVFGQPGLHVMDGSVMPANPGVNPSLMITGLAERAMSLWPNKGEADSRPPLGAGYERVVPIMPHRPVVPAGAPGELRLDAKKSEIIPEYPY